MPRYVFQAGSSNRFWEIDVKGSSTTVRQGKIGTAGQVVRKDHASPAAARASAAALIAEKEKKGYVEERARSGQASRRAAKALPKGATKGGRAGEEVLRRVVDGFQALAARITAAGLEATFERRRGATPTQIAHAERARGKTFPQPLKTLLGVSNGFSLHAKPRVEGADRVFHRIWSTDDHIRCGDCKGIFWFHDDDESDSRNFVNVDDRDNGSNCGYVVDGDPESDPALAFHAEGDTTAGPQTLVAYLTMVLDEGHRWLEGQLEPPLNGPNTKLEELFSSFDQSDDVVSLAFKDGSNPSLSALTSLECRKLWIRDAPHDLDVESLARMQNLVELQLDFAREASPSPGGFAALSTSGFPALRKLSLMWLTIESVDFLRWLPALEQVTIYRSRWTSGDGASTVLGTLEADSLPALESLSIDVVLDSVDFLKACPRLEALAIRGDERGTEHAALRGPVTLPRRLRKLELSQLGLTRVPDLRGGESLEHLELEGNAIEELSGLERFQNLKTINLFNNRLRSLRGLEAARGLETLVVGDNHGISLEGVDQFVNLRTLRADGCSLSKPLDLTALSRLEDLHLGDNELTAPPRLASAAPLRELRLHGSKLKEPPELVSFTALIRVHLERNQLTQVPRFPSGVKLEHLGLDSNPLEDLTGLEDLSTDKGATVSLRDVGLPPKVKSGLKKRYGKALDLRW